MTDRVRPPGHRQCEVHSFEFAGIAYRGAISRFADGSLAEIFLDATSVKSTAPVQHIAHALAIVASIALQRGATAEELAHGLPRVDIPGSDKSEAADPLGRLLDLINSRREG